MKKILLTSLCILGLTVAFNVTEAKASEEVESDEMSILQTRATMSPANLNGIAGRNYLIRIGSSYSGIQNFRFHPGVGGGEIRRDSTASTYTFNSRWVANAQATYYTYGQVLNPEYGMSNRVNGTAKMSFY